MTYPLTYNFAYAADVRRRAVQLQEGSRHYPSKKAGGTTYDLRNITYVDLNGDGRKEAVVRISQVICGVSCDGGSDFFYFYAVKSRKPLLLSRIEAGSLAYDCGLKSFVLKNQRLTLETFRACLFSGAQVLSADADLRGQISKFHTNRYTKFDLQFSGKRFVLRKRKIFKTSDENVMNYVPKIEISDE